MDKGGHTRLILERRGAVQQHDSVQQHDINLI